LRLRDGVKSDSYAVTPITGANFISNAAARDMQVHAPQILPHRVGDASQLAAMR
jgi:hypothetical protein